MASSASGQFGFTAQLEYLQRKYVGTGHADTTKLEWATNIKRDTNASHIGNHSRMMYFATAQNESLARLRYQFLNDLHNPCGQEPPQTRLQQALATRDGGEARDP